jgi:hypothetical protein
MIWIKLGILLTGFLFAGLLPYSVKKALRHIDFDLNRQTLSFLSNRKLYGKQYQRGYSRLLFASAILIYAFFWLLSKFYDLGEYEKLMRYIDYSFAFLTLLAFVPHNIKPYSIHNFGYSLQRLTHNFLAICVFLALPGLIIVFQYQILPEIRFLGISGMAIILFVILSTLWSVIANGVNGVTEIIFINGISVWSIYVTVITFLH